MSLAKAITSS